MDKEQQIISKLKFIGKIRSGEKINVPGMFVQPDGLVTKISRTMYALDNRLNTLNLVNETIFESSKILTSHLSKDSPSSQNLCRNLIHDLVSVKSGIYNLKKTYEEDIKFGCDLETVLQSIDSKLLEVKASYPQYFSENG